ncbi:antizyme inhibitor 2-like isoform X2 [Ruditapes philippinarum]|nr:antizyme inhibitor 2-like isoform X2 [Ruditapes philippinarum]
MPRVKIFYAVKCNSSEPLLKVLADMGVSFDCASKNEIEAVLKLGISPTRIVYAHPYKPVSSLLHAKYKDVSLMTFDCSEELFKVKEFYPSARLLLRLLPEVEFQAEVQFNGKFGCPLSDVENVLRVAKQLNLNIVGVSFHVGSGVQDPKAYVPILHQSKKVFDIANSLGFVLNVLDIGGGFPGHQGSLKRFEAMSTVINKTLEEMFPPSIEIIAEPGRYIVASAFTVVAYIFGKRCHSNVTCMYGKDSNRENSMSSNHETSTTYFLNDSIFGSFVDCCLCRPGSEEYTPNILRHKSEDKLVESTISGFAPFDVLNKSVMLPDLNVGDWIYYENMGAYTMSMATSFNGISVPDIMYHCLENLWHDVYSDQRLYCTKRP